MREETYTPELYFYIYTDLPAYTELLKELSDNFGICEDLKDEYNKEEKLRILEQLKQIDFSKYDLNELQRKAVDDALVEVSLRVGDLQGVQDYLSKYKTFRYKTAADPLEIVDLTAFEGHSDFIDEDYFKSDNEFILDSEVYEELVDVIESPLTLKPKYEPFATYFDQIIMLFAVALEEGNVKEYIDSCLLPYDHYQYAECSLISGAIDMEQVEVVKMLLDHGAMITRDDYRFCHNEEIKNLFNQHCTKIINSRLEQAFLTDRKDSPSYGDIMKWVSQYGSIFLIAKQTGGKYHSIELNSDFTIYTLFTMNKRLSSVLFIKKADNNKIEGLKEEIKKQKTIVMVSLSGINRTLTTFILTKSVLYKDHADPVFYDSTVQDSFLRATLPINGIQNLHEYVPRQEYREPTEADFWSEVYEHANEYIDNH